MSRNNVIAATFRAVGDATAAVDWFRNQAVDPQAIGIMAVAKGERPRPTQAGDNQRSDLSWIVSIDLDRARLSRQIAIETMRREGGKIASPAAMTM